MAEMAEIDGIDIIDGIDVIVGISQSPTTV